jgi:hypothetical protein
MGFVMGVWAWGSLESALQIIIGSFQLLICFFQLIIVPFELIAFPFALFDIKLHLPISLSFTRLVFSLFV